MTSPRRGLKLDNADMSKVVHLGHNDMEYESCLGNQKIKVVNDLGVIISSTLNSEAQCAKAVKLANATFGVIKRTFVFTDKEIMLPLSKSLIRPKLAYCIQALLTYAKT